MLNALKALIAREPLAIVGALATAVVYLAAQANIVIDHASLVAVLAPVVTAVIGRFFVSPATAAE